MAGGGLIKVSLEFAIFLIKNRRFGWQIVADLPWRFGWISALSSISKPLHSKVQLLLIYLLLHSTHKSLLALEEFSHLALLFWTTMADLEHSTSDDASVDSRAEDPSQDSKLEFSEDEETLITRMYNLVGERWSLIAGRIPGRTAEEIEKYWNSRYSTSG
ncbi:hypothetical protein HYC85_014403 [Camellia sinensis]|uniref:Uncharacterized protein n=2 Tax=Camellia sinensis TaxID=4442 RepID=A0A7J7H9L0_CAMSI|nr:hypothetical protein HYC85_014403 [Camellia sinensis]